jgi:PAS domain S-box-containing protein
MNMLYRRPTHRAFPPIAPVRFPLLLLGLRFAPVYWVGAFLIGAMVKPMWLAAIFATGDVLSALTEWWVLTRLVRFDIRFQNVLDVPAFVIVSALSTLVGASVGVGSQVGFQLLPPSIAPSMFLTWWLGNVTGVLVTTPVLLRASQEWRRELRLSRRTWEMIALYSLVAILPILVSEFHTGVKTYALWQMLSWPILLWSALRFGLVGAPSAVMLLSFGTILVFLVKTQGDAAQARQDLWDVWAHSTALSITGLLVMALDALRRQSDQALRESEERHRELFQNAAIGIHRSSMDGVILDANTAFLRMLGLEESDLKRRQVLRAEFENTDDRKIVLEGTLLGREAVWKRKDGTEVYVRENGRVYQDGQGNSYYEGTAEDITERREAERRLAASHEALAAKNVELKQALDAAQEATRMKDRFLANVSHEIRTPMHGVLGAADLLRSTLPPGEQSGFVEIIHSSARALLSLLNQLLDLSKIESGRFELESAPFRLDEVLEEATSLHAIGARAKNVQFETRLDAVRGHWVLGDALRLRQILNNLLGNAVKFTDSGSVRLEAEVMPESGNRRRYRIGIIDTGVGFDPAKNPRLFQAFIQANTSDARRHGGTGLGLAISRQLVELMGGKIDVDSKPGKGTAFHIELTWEIAREPERAPVDSAAPSPVGHYRLLLVEDNAVNQKIAAVMLARGGYSVEIASDGQTALAMLEAQPFDLVLMDVQMPGMDGLEATRILRSREKAGSRVPVIALTASATDSDRERCMLAGMDDHVSKPISQDELLRVVYLWTAASGSRVESYKA